MLDVSLGLFVSQWQASQTSNISKVFTWIKNWLALPPPLPEGHPTFKASESQPWVNLAPKQTLCFVTLVCEQLAIIYKELLQKFSRLCWIGMEGNSRVGDYPFSYKQAINR